MEWAARDPGFKGAGSSAAVSVDTTEKLGAGWTGLMAVFLVVIILVV